MPTIEINQMLFERLQRAAEAAGYRTTEALAVRAIEKELASVEVRLTYEPAPARSAADIVEALQQIRKRSKPGPSIREMINEGRRF